MARQAAEGNRPAGLFPRDLKGFPRDFSVFRADVPENWTGSARMPQLLISGLISFSKASNEVSPFTAVPLTKKNGVELTFSLL